MRRFSSLPMTRRQVLAGAAALGVSAATGVAKADSASDDLARNRVLRNTDREGNTAAALDAIGTNEPILSADTAYNLDLAIRRYEQIVGAGGWEEMSRTVYGLIAGVTRNSVITLKRRLMLMGDMPEKDRVNTMFDQDADAAIRRFQARHGLLVTGKVDAETFYALNVPAEDRLAQLRVNSLRVANMSSSLGDRYLVVNIPAAAIETVEAGTVFRRHTAIVGRIDRQTPILSSSVRQINFNPYWHVPKSIIRRDIIKYMNEDPDYLTRYQIRIYDPSGAELNPTNIDWSTDDAVNYAFRQDPGSENAMGHVKINFSNPYDVYLHDTPTKSLFGENRRFHSSGCVRVENVDALVAWILSGDGWDLAAVDGAFDSGERLDVDVSKPVPIHTAYITAWANRQGTISFRDDVYDFDAQGKVTFDT